MAENGTETKMIKVTVKTPKEKKDIEVEANSTVELVRQHFSSLIGIIHVINKSTQSENDARFLLFHAMVVKTVVAFLFV